MLNHQFSVVNYLHTSRRSCSSPTKIDTLVKSISKDLKLLLGCKIASFTIGLSKKKRLLSSKNKVYMFHRLGNEACVTSIIAVSLA